MAGANFQIHRDRLTDVLQVMPVLGLCDLNRGGSRRAAGECVSVSKDQLGITAPAFLTASVFTADH